MDNINQINQKKPFFAQLIGKSLSIFVSLLTGVRPKFDGSLNFTPENNIYFANHASHGDFVLVWLSLPEKWRKMARPVAGADYWLKGKIRRFIAQKVFNALLIMRNSNDPKIITEQMSVALREGSSLIIFPEGTRNTQDDTLLLPFKTGIYHLAKANPNVKLIPIWIDNINRVLPKGNVIPIPIACEVMIGDAIELQPNESKEEFLSRARQALIALAPEYKRDNLKY